MVCRGNLFFFHFSLSKLRSAPCFECRKYFQLQGNLSICKWKLCFVELVFRDKKVFQTSHAQNVGISWCYHHLWTCEHSLQKKYSLVFLYHFILGIVHLGMGDTLLLHQFLSKLPIEESSSSPGGSQLPCSAIWAFGLCNRFVKRCNCLWGNNS